MANEIKVVRCNHGDEIFETLVNDQLKDGWEIESIHAVVVKENRLEHVAYLKRKSY